MGKWRKVNNLRKKKIVFEFYNLGLMEDKVVVLWLCFSLVL